MRDLLDLTMLYIVKSEHTMNKHLFTLDILENQHIVELIQTFCLFEIDQFSNVFERYSLRPINLKLNLLLYKKICDMYMLLIDSMRGERYKMPANEITKCSVMQKTLPEFIHIMNT